MSRFSRGKVFEQKNERTCAPQAKEVMKNREKTDRRAHVSQKGRVEERRRRVVLTSTIQRKKSLLRCLFTIPTKNVLIHASATSAKRKETLLDMDLDGTERQRRPNLRTAPSEEGEISRQTEALLPSASHTLITLECSRYRAALSRQICICPFPGCTRHTAA